MAATIRARHPVDASGFRVVVVDRVAMRAFLDAEGVVLVWIFSEERTVSISSKRARPEQLENARLSMTYVDLTELCIYSRGKILASSSVSFNADQSRRMPRTLNPPRDAQMSPSLPLVNYPKAQKKLHDSLVLLYGRLGEVVNGQRDFGGFIAPDDLDKKFQLKTATYPRLSLTFSQADHDLLVGYAGMSRADLLACATTPLERLMAATLWKQNDLGKIGYIAAGIVEKIVPIGGKDSGTKAPIFKQFGRHLSGPHSQPIVDQHSLRAYRYLLGQDLCDHRHRLDTVKAQEVKSYIDWVQALAGRGISEVGTDHLYEFDRSMFALGKATKSFIHAVISYIE